MVVVMPAIFLYWCHVTSVELGLYHIRTVTYVMMLNRVVCFILFEFFLFDYTRSKEDIRKPRVAAVLWTCTIFVSTDWNNIDFTIINAETLLNFKKELLNF